MNEGSGDARALMEQFQRLSHILKKDFMRSVTAEFKPTAAMILMRLWQRKKHGEEGIRVSELANVMGITVPAVTQLVTGLESRGMVAREMDLKDRRAIRVSLTDSGEATLLPFFARFNESFGGLVATLGANDTGELLRLLAKVERHFSETLGVAPCGVHADRTE